MQSAPFFLKWFLPSPFYVFVARRTCFKKSLKKWRQSENLRTKFIYIHYHLQFKQITWLMLELQHQSGFYCALLWLSHEGFRYSIVKSLRESSWKSLGIWSLEVGILFRLGLKICLYRSLRCLLTILFALFEIGDHKNSLFKKLGQVQKKQSSKNSILTF